MRMCETPEMPVVNTSARCVAPLAMTGGAPTASRKLLEVRP
jgi:hypothetical protein